MAGGLFGKFFQYEKPGPGVDKNAPKEKGVRLFFRILKEKFWKLIPLSLLMWLFSIPVVTIGLATVGSAYITRNFSREKSVFLKDDFFGAIKKNWKQALPIGFINTLITAILVFAMYFYFMGWQMTFFYKAGFVIAGMILVVFTCMRYYIPTLMVTFRLNWKQLYKNALLLSSAGLKENLIITLAIILLYGSVGALIYLLIEIIPPLAAVLFILAFLLLPGIRALIVQFFAFPVIQKHIIDPYYKEHPEEKKERYLLNLEDDEDEEEEHVFEDAAAAEAEAGFPHQYGEEELAASRRRTSVQDDDDTI